MTVLLTFSIILRVNSCFFFRFDEYVSCRIGKIAFLQSFRVSPQVKRSQFKIYWIGKWPKVTPFVPLLRNPVTLRFWKLASLLMPYPFRVNCQNFKYIPQGLFLYRNWTGAEEAVSLTAAAAQRKVPISETKKATKAKLWEILFLMDRRKRTKFERKEKRFLHSRLEPPSSTT